MRNIDINQASVDLQLLTEFESKDYTVAYRGEEGRYTEEMKEAILSAHKDTIDRLEVANDKLIETYEDLIELKKESRTTYKKNEKLAVKNKELKKELRDITNEKEKLEKELLRIKVSKGEL
ncbi:hypothetical protein [Listeria phage LMTA-57]|uniref:Uncharacterized protein n=3 Tax=Pecentumvirus TaxID=1857844 RepID=A0A060AC05_9CAUD|nr:hypothetical protein HH39_gp052 [Listeria phage LMSP-25]YP_009616155.1 hypothetical protein FDI77_gp052 [Listeria phage LMTA-34]YP_009793490.1 hypothetical protein QLX42_gp161 [Listeria phage LMTA-57]AIA64395.1 hypothetical protein [Listeria phage LMSP-25]AID16953.1 hypothetical protein [Listeria phage LMTA-34]AID17641.1 hypothetical protein [Listeria phage LMTA-57]